MINDRWFILRINPEPWAIGPLSIGRKGGKLIPFVGPNAQLSAFKEAVREELKLHSPIVGPVCIDLFVWRQLEQSTTPTGRKRRANAADATNLQKAIEDGLQGKIIENDRQVKRISTTVIEQGQDVSPLVVGHVYPWVEFDTTQIPKYIMDIAREKTRQPLPWDDPDRDIARDFFEVAQRAFNQGQGSLLLPMPPVILGDESVKPNPKDYF